MIDSYCEFCGSGRLFLTKGSIQRRINGSLREICDIEFMKCEFCGERTFLPSQEKALLRRIDIEVRKSKGLLTPEEIRDIRTSLKLTQQELAKIMGCGKSSLSRWEKGGLKQSRMVDNFLRIINDHPETVLGARKRDKSGFNAREPQSPPQR